MIGDRIKEARLRLGYSAEQVAAFLGVSPATVYRYENGDISKLPSKFIKPLADYLCVSPGYLMGWSEEPPEPVQVSNRSITSRIISGGVERMPAEKQKEALKILQTIYADYFKEDDHDDPEL